MLRWHFIYPCMHAVRLSNSIKLRRGFGRHYMGTSNTQGPLWKGFIAFKAKYIRSPKSSSCAKFTLQLKMLFSFYVYFIFEL